MGSLWSFDEEFNLENPVEILREQIQYLQEITKKSVNAELVEEKSGTGDPRYAFVINSSRLPNYSYKAFTIQCSPIFYPVTIQCDGNIAKQLGTVDYGKWGAELVCDIYCEDTEKFKTELKRILGTKYIKQVVAAVKVMAESKK